MEMFDPPHPGGIIREECLKPLGLTVTDAAKGLGITVGGCFPELRSMPMRRTMAPP